MTTEIIEAWVTTHTGEWVTALDRSEASPFRRFAFRRDINEPGVGSLEYHLANATVNAYDDLFKYGHLVWFRNADKTRTWIIEDRSTVLDRSEHATDWVKVSGPGTLALTGDRTIWPTHYSDATPDPSQWEFGRWSTKTSASAALGQTVVPVVSTTAGDGASVNDPVEIVGGGQRQIGIIDSIVAGVSVTLKDNLAYTFPKGSRVRGAARQWRRFVNRAAGEMLWDLISESNARFTAATGQAPIVRGTIETTGADGWTQDFRFDNLLDVIKAVTDVYGDVEMDGLTFNYYNAIGTDRSDTVILEEGADVEELHVSDSDRDSLSWVVAEGTGHAVFSYLAPKEKLTRAQRKTAARNRKLHRKAPAAPRKVIEVKADYTVDLASEAVGYTRRREAFLDAKDVSDLGQLDALADAVLEEHQVEEAVSLEANETRYRIDRDYTLGDWVRVIVPSRGFDEDVRIVSISLAEDDRETIRAAIDVNTVREDRLLRQAKRLRDTRASLGVQNRQPQGQLVPYSFSGQGILDTGSPLYIYVKIPDRLYVLTEAKVTLAFRQFLAPATAAASSGTLTSDSGGGSTTTSGGGATSGSTTVSIGRVNPGMHAHTDPGGGITGFEDGLNGLSYIDSIGPHSHSTPNHSHATPDHQHTVPGHGHGLTYGTFEETYPVSHSVTLRVYERTDTTWTLRGTFSGLTADIEDVDLVSVMPYPGDWRLTVQSAAAQPNGGRLGCDVYGALTGAIQSA